MRLLLCLLPVACTMSHEQVQALADQQIKEGIDKLRGKER